MAGMILAVGAVPVIAQQGGRAPAGSSATPAPATASPTVASPGAEPERTTATFGDWTLRCERLTEAGPRCEAAQALAANNQTIAQFAFGYPAPGNALRFTVLVPNNVGFAGVPRLVAPEGGVPPIELAWRRCLPVGCLADAAPGEAVARLRARTEPMRLLFQDGAGREVALPFSPRGLSSALDALPR